MNELLQRVMRGFISGRVRVLWMACAVALLDAGALRAQVLATPVPVAAPTRAALFVRAQRLVNDGNGAEGRAIVDSLLNATEPRSPEEAEVLYWRATLAENWDRAQRDYLRIMLEHERSAFAAPAMLRLAQGELMRADTVAALRYLDRLLAAWPATADAMALRTRLRPAVVATTPAPSDSARTPASRTTPNTPPTAPATGGSNARGTLVWTVQIAAFPTADEAATLAAQIRERGYDTRVDGIAAPFRVRFGYYSTRAAAAAAMQAYKDKERGEAFLTQVTRP